MICKQDPTIQKAAEREKERSPSEGIVEEVTDRKRMEAELQHYRDHLEERVRDFTAELRATNEMPAREIAEREKVEDRLRRC